MNLFKGGELSLEDAKNIDEIQYLVQATYNKYIECLIKENKLSGIDLLLTATCRNTASSDIYDNLCRIELLEENLKQKKKDEIEIHGEESILQLAVQVFDKYKVSGVEFKKTIKHKNKFVFVFMNILKSIYLIVNSWFWPRVFFVKKRPIEDITYIDTFLFIDSINDAGIFSERYYTSHEKYLTKNVIESEWFAPTLVNIRHPTDFISICRDINRTKNKFLLQESWLTISDYIFALVFSIILPFKIKKYPAYNGYDISGIFKKEVLEDIGSPALMKALCQYRFIRRLAKEKIKIKRAINWAENQNIDRALNIGFKKYYPDVTVYGYQGFPVLNYYASTQPTCYELKAGTLPDVLGVVCPSCIPQRKSVCDKLKLELFPAFRFSYLFNILDSRPKNIKIILIALPGFDVGESKQIIKEYLKMSQEIKGSVRVIIKQHPGYTIDQFAELVPEFLSPCFEHTDKTFSELLGSVSVLISSASSVCVEAVAVGIPVLIHANRFGITMNSIPANISEDLWGVFYTHHELLDLISLFLQKKERNSIVSEIFCPVNEDGARSLFGY